MFKLNHRKVFGRSVAGYGVAMASLSMAHYADAGIVDLTGNLNPSQPFQGPASAGSYQAILGGGADFYQFNDTIGKTLRVFGDLAGIRIATYSNAITTGMAFSQQLNFGTADAALRTFGFLTTSNQVGWIKIDFGGSGGAISYLAAAYNDEPDGNIHAGKFETVSTAVPEPSSAALGLGMLALGAVGLRNIRRKQAAG